MPNQRSKDKVHTSLSLPRQLVREIEGLAQSEERSRNKMIEILLRERVREYHCAHDDPGDYRSGPEVYQKKKRAS